MKTKITLIDWAKKIMDVEEIKEFIQVVELESGTKLMDELTEIDMHEMVKAVKKVYQLLILHNPKGEKELYYVNMEDVKRFVPIIESIIAQLTEKLGIENQKLKQERQLMLGAIQTYQRRWYNRLIDGIMKRRARKLMVQRGPGRLSLASPMNRPGYNPPPKVAKRPVKPTPTPPPKADKK